MFITKHYLILLFTYICVLYAIDPMLRYLHLVFLLVYILQRAFKRSYLILNILYLVITPRKDCTAVNSPLTSLIAKSIIIIIQYLKITDTITSKELDPPVLVIEKLFLVSRV